MATIVQCDGCGVAITETPVVRGIALKREYCEACAEIAKTFEQVEASLRESLYERFMTDRQLLIAKFSEGGFLLPDVTHD